MKSFTRVFIRPHNEVDFYQPSKEFLDHIQKEYIDTGKCLKFREATFKDENELILKLTSEWANGVDFSEIMNNDTSWKEEVKKELDYNKSCEIILLDKKFNE